MVSDIYGSRPQFEIICDMPVCTVLIVKNKFFFFFFFWRQSVQRLHDDVNDYDIVLESAGTDAADVACLTSAFIVSSIREKL